MGRRGVKFGIARKGLGNGGGKKAAGGGAGGGGRAAPAVF